MTGEQLLPPPQIAIQFAPIDVETDVQQTQLGGAQRVLLVVTTPQGVQGFFLSAEHAQHLAGELATAGRAAASGLLIVGDTSPA